MESFMGEWGPSSSVKHSQQPTKGRQLVRPGPIESLYAACTATLSSVVAWAEESHDIPKPLSLKIKRSFQLLRVWGDGHDVLSGSLDRMLAYSDGLNFTVLNALISLAELISKQLVGKLVETDSILRETLERTNIERIIYDSKLAISSIDDSWISHAQFSSSDSEGESIQDLSDDIKTYIRVLLDLSPSIEAPTIDTGQRNEEMPQVELLSLNSSDNAYAHEEDMKLIRQRVPKAAKWIVEQSVKANNERRRRLDASRKDAILSRLSDSNDTKQELHPRAALPSFYDSRLGTRTPVERSSGRSTGQSLRIPRLSESAERGEVFECVACGELLRVKSYREWTEHLYSDLRPYICFVEHCDCNETPFTEINDWSAHMTRKHDLDLEQYNMDCPICRKMSGEDRETILTHLGHHLEEIALLALPRKVNVENSPEPGIVSRQESSTTVYKIQGGGSVTSNHKPRDEEPKDDRPRELRSGDALDINAEDVPGGASDQGNPDISPRTPLRTALPIEVPVKGKMRAGFEKDPVTSVSRPVNITEQRAIHDFEKHACRCNICHRPYDVYKAGQSLCKRGYSLAQEVAAQLFNNDGDTFSTVREKHKYVRVEIQEGYDEVRGLLKAIERSLRHRRGAPFVQTDRPYFVSPSASNSYGRIEVRQRKAFKSGQAIDRPRHDNMGSEDRARNRSPPPKDSKAKALFLSE